MTVCNKKNSYTGKNSIIYRFFFSNTIINAGAKTLRAENIIKKAETKL